MGFRAFREKHFPTTVARDLFGLVAGARLSFGISREVFAYKLDERLVIKFERGAYAFQNVVEWETWERVEDSPALKRWLAPCTAISPCGRVLVQRRTWPVPPHVKMPKRVPALLADLKRDNWGYLDGRIVCHDYGFTRVTGVDLEPASFGGRT
ncbi:MAG: hypothetical protein WD871_01695 [Xanthobacteraceae bacterium]